MVDEEIESWGQIESCLEPRVWDQASWDDWIRTELCMWDLA